MKIIEILKSMTPLYSVDHQQIKGRMIIMAGKRYYWLKLYEDIFEQEEILYLETLENRDYLIVVYIKILLRSLKGDGTIYIPKFMNFYQGLSLSLHEPEEKLQKAIPIIAWTGLIDADIKGNSITIPNIKELVGSETDSARRMRNYRRRQKDANYGRQ